MIKDISFVLFMGKSASLIYNFVQSKSKVKHDTEHTFERKNICKKTFNALVLETSVYGLIFVLSLIFGK